MMGIVLHPMMGYPFTLDVSVDYILGEDGPTVRTSATNIGETACPYGAGRHPYLSVGTDVVDPCRLELAAAYWLASDDRGLPTDHRVVAGSPGDYRTAREIGEAKIDYTFTGLVRDEQGRAWVRFSAPSGRTLAVWVDDNDQFIEIYTPPTQPTPYWRHGLGVDPMTCAPNAFRTGEGLIRLEPGHSSAATWDLRVEGNVQATS